MLTSVARTEDIILVIDGKEYTYTRSLNGWENEESFNYFVAKHTTKSVLGYYVDENFTTDISNKELAKLANMSQNHFLNIFKKLNNLTPYNYIVRKRIEYALKLLDETDMSVLDVAYACGFNNTASFYSLFKKYIGKSPSEVRKLN